MTDVPALLRTVIDNYSVPARPLPKLAVVGYGWAGKDCFSDYVVARYGYRYNGSTSIHLLPYRVAQVLDCTVDEAQQRPDYDQVAEKLYETRHADRDAWYELGNRLRHTDPGVLVRPALQNADLLTGVRDACEVEHAREQKLVSAVIWIDNPRKPIDPTVKFDRSIADLIILNDTTYETYYRRIDAVIGGLAGIPLFTKATPA
jgi:hypothetical protein